MDNSNLSLPSNVFSVNVIRDSDTDEFRIDPEDNAEYFRELENVRQFRTADDGDVYLRQMGEKDERPWARIFHERMNKYVEICYCERQECPCFLNKKEGYEKSCRARNPRYHPEILE